MAVNNDLVLKPISELLDKSFYIPAYQRGYRWTKRQVTELLDDIKEFQQQAEDGSKEAFYCLQPIVVKKHNEAWELVDGQQRLTTIFIILTYLKDILTLLGKSRYQLSYETREDSAEFLNHIDETRGQENIDFYHIVEAKKAVDDWFKSQDGTYQIKFIQTLLNDDDTGKNVKVIWYQIGEHEDVTDVFTRLNMGKIPLVNAELVKALFLRSSNFNGDNKTKQLTQLNIASEWDHIEKSLQNDEFWYFISNNDKSANRIEFVLDLAALKLCRSDVMDKDKLKTFLQFNQRLNQDGVNVSKEWLHVKQCFMQLEEWFHDREMFHLVGFLVSQGVSITELYKRCFQVETKTAFKAQLKELIFTHFITKKTLIDLTPELISDYLSQLDYNSKSEHKLIKASLLLFNIASLQANFHTNVRFQFNRFKSQFWDIEHIRSITSNRPLRVESQKIWLNNVVEYISNNSSDTELQLRNQAEELLSANVMADTDFTRVYEQVVEHYDSGGNDEVNNSIGNLTLLDSSSNRSYKNAVFPIKRAKIIALDKQATFVPLCTKNVFLKYYSKQVDKMLYWEDSDSQEHQQAIGEVIYDFFATKGAIK